LGSRGKDKKKGGGRENNGGRSPLLYLFCTFCLTRRGELSGKERGKKKKKKKERREGRREGKGTTFLISHFCRCICRSPERGKKKKKERKREGGGVFFPSAASLSEHSISERKKKEKRGKGQIIGIPLLLLFPLAGGKEGGGEKRQRAMNGEKRFLSSPPSLLGAMCGLSTGKKKKRESSRSLEIPSLIFLSPIFSCSLYHHLFTYDNRGKKRKKRGGMPALSTNFPTREVKGQRGGKKEGGGESSHASCRVFDIVTALGK